MGRVCGVCGVCGAPKQVDMKDTVKMRLFVCSHHHYLVDLSAFGDCLIVTS